MNKLNVRLLSRFTQAQRRQAAGKRVGRKKRQKVENNMRYVLILWCCPAVHSAWLPAQRQNPSRQPSKRSEDSNVKEISWTAIIAAPKVPRWGKPHSQPAFGAAGVKIKGLFWPGGVIIDKLATDGQVRSCVKSSLSSIKAVVDTTLDVLRQLGERQVTLNCNMHHFLPLPTRLLVFLLVTSAIFGHSAPSVWR